jgi:tripartite motif-containing protein 71
MENARNFLILTLTSILLLPVVILHLDISNSRNVFSQEDTKSVDVCQFRHVKKFSPQGELIAAWGKRGTADGEVLHGHSIDIDSDGNVYVSDDDRKIIQKFDNSGKFIAKWGSEGPGPGQFQSLEGEIVISPEDILYVVDFGKGRIEEFDKDGNFIKSWGTKGGGIGELNRPWGIEFDKNGNIFVTEHNIARIQQFNKDGNFVQVWWDDDEDTETKFTHLHDIATNKQGIIYIELDTLFKKLDKEGNLISEWGTPGSGPGQFKDPHGMDFDSKGNIYIADTANHRIQKFASDGKYITSWGEMGIEDHQFIMPFDVALDSSDNIYVVDNGFAHNDANDVSVSYVQEFLEENPPPESCEFDKEAGEKN